MIRFAIADDDPYVRSALRRWLAQEPDLECVGDAADGHEAIQLVQRVAVDVLLLDLVMPRLGGLQALPEVRQAAPATRVLVLSSSIDAATRARAMDAGASACLPKGGHPRNITEAIRSAAAA